MNNNVKKFNKIFILLTILTLGISLFVKETKADNNYAYLRSYSYQPRINWQNNYPSYDENYSLRLRSQSYQPSANSQQNIEYPNEQQQNRQTNLFTNNIQNIKRNNEVSTQNNNNNSNYFINKNNTENTQKTENNNEGTILDADNTQKIKEGFTDMSANALTGSRGFMPNGLFQWILLFVMVIAIIILWRYINRSEEEYMSTPLKHA